jgi:hypothetical protein
MYVLAPRTLSRRLRTPHPNRDVPALHVLVQGALSEQRHMTQWSPSKLVLRLASDFDSLSETKWPGSDIRFCYAYLL